MTSAEHGFGAIAPVRPQPYVPRHDDPLPRLLVQLIARMGEPTDIERAVSRPWASALFEGRRHEIRLRISGDDFPARGMAFLKGLREAEWPLPGHFVADIDVDGGDGDMDSAWIDLSILTIRDW
ncbi:hypothetical protein [Sphingobium sp.]|uniref:hypothetical protein n=1 Tax=Sphingobium sp. TaxID=1912891 RepID=UPI003B3B4755